MACCDENEKAKDRGALILPVREGGEKVDALYLYDVDEAGRRSGGQRAEQCPWCGAKLDPNVGLSAPEA